MSLYKRILSSEEALGRANTHLENARNAKDRRQVLNFCDEAKEALERMDISKTTKDRERIMVAYREHGKMLEKLGFDDEAQLSYNEADKLSGATDQKARVVPLNVDTARSSTHSLSDVPNPATFSDAATTSNKESVIPNIFTKDCPPHVSRCTFPGPDERIVSTRQLASCLALLHIPSSVNDSLDPESLSWLKVTEKNQDEKDRLETLATDLIGALAPGYIDADDLVKILELLSTRLQETFQQSPQLIYELTITVSRVLDAVADINVQGLDRDKLHEPLLSYLERLKASKNPYIVYQAAYAFQALLSVPDNEKPWQAALPRSGAVIKGVGGLASSIKELNIAEFINGLRNIQEGLHRAGQIFALVQDTYNEVTALKESGEGLLDELKNGVSFSHKRTWYIALRGADSLIQNGELTKFKILVCEAPCRRELAFQWGICQRLGYLALDPVLDDGTRNDAIALLGEMYWNDEEWGQEPRIKQCILNILLQLSQVPGNAAKGPVNVAAEELLKDLATDGDENKQGLYTACIQNGPSMHSWKLGEPLPDSSSLTDKLHNLVERSKTDDRFSQDAANAITILIRAGVQFNGADLRGIRVPGADLSCGYFDSAQLQGADLRNTILESVWLRHADLSDSQMDCAVFEQWPNLQQTDDVTCCVYSPDGKRLTIVLFDGSIGLYDTSTWSRVDLRAQASSERIAMGEISVSVGDHSDIVSDNPDFVDNQPCEVSFVEFIPRSQQMYFDNNNGTVCLKDERTGTLIFSLSGHADRVNSVTRSADGKQIASCSEDKTVRLWDLQTGALSRILTGHTNAVWCLTYSPNSQQIASGSGDNTVRLWDTRTGALSFILNGHANAVRTVAYSPNGQHIASGSLDGIIRLWDARIGTPQYILNGHISWITTLAFSPSGHQISSGSRDKTVRMWNPQTGSLMFTLRGHTSLVTSVTYSPNGQQIVSGSRDSTARLWDVQTGLLLSILSGHTDAVGTATYSPDGKQIASGSSDKSVRLWNQQTGTREFSLNSHIDSVMSVACSSSNQRVVSGSEDKTLRLWDSQTGAFYFTLNGHTDWIRSVAYSPNGQQIASGSEDCTVRLWDSKSGSLIHTLSNHISGVLSVAYSPDGLQIASGSWDETIQLWDLPADGTPSRVLILSDHTDSVMSVAYSPDGQQIASGSCDKTVRLWDAQTGTLRSTLEGHTDSVYSVVYSPSGQQIASGSQDMTVRLWDVQTGALDSILSGHRKSVNSVTYSPNRKLIASASDDKTVRLWDLDSGHCLIVLDDFQDAVNAIVWLNEESFVVGCDDSCVSTWTVVEEEEEKMRLCLRWRSGPNNLVLSDASIQGVQGLSEMNARIFQQYQQKQL